MMHIVIYVKYHHPCTNLKLTSIFGDVILKNTGIPNFRKIRLLGAELLHADGHTHMTNLISHFSQFCERA